MTIGNRKNEISDRFKVNDNLCMIPDTQIKLLICKFDTTTERNLSSKKKLVTLNIITF